MAWRCSGRTNPELIANLRSAGLIHSPLVASAMTAIDRANYCPDLTTAYADSPQTINYGATISAPHMHAQATENLLPFLLKPGAKVLDVGSGSGYTMAIFHKLTDGTVVGIDHIKELVEQAKTNLEKDGLGQALDSGKIKVVFGDGRKGVQEEAPFDAIHVGAAAPSMPKELIEQLKRPGRMFIPVEDSRGYGQDIWQVDKDEDGRVTQTRLYGVNYVPLTDAQKQWKST